MSSSPWHISTEVFGNNDGGRAPRLTSQTSYFVSGAFAAASALPIDLLWNRFATPRPNTILPSLHTLAGPAIYRGGVRFWVFDHARHRIRHRFSLPPWLVGGLSGALGGFAEICVQSAASRHMPDMKSLANQSGKLFCCFGTYTYLSTTLSPEQLPPKPFWRCWCMGAVAGGVGSGIVAAIGGLRGKELWTRVMPKGAAGIGTVIAVQVTACDEMIRWIDEISQVD